MLYCHLLHHVAAPMMEVLPIRRKVNSAPLERTPATRSWQKLQRLHDAEILYVVYMSKSLCEDLLFFQ